MEETCPPCRLLVMVGVAGELAEELELLLENKKDYLKYLSKCAKSCLVQLYHHNFSELKKSVKNFCENTWWGQESLVLATLERRRAREVRNAAKNIQNYKRKMLKRLSEHNFKMSVEKHR